MNFRAVLIVLVLSGVGRGQEPMRLTLKNAVDLAMAPDGNTRVRLSRELLAQAQTRAAQARAALLPNIDGYVSQQNITRNLAAFGIRFRIPGFQIPELAGPFNVFDARGSVTQSLFDFSSIRRLQAARAATSAAQADEEYAHSQVTGEIARLYLGVLRAVAAVETAEANVKAAAEVLELSQSQKRAGTGTGIEVTRAEVQLANQRQRLLITQNQRERARLLLLRAMGLEMSTAFELTERLAYQSVDLTGADEALKTAEKERADLKAQELRVRAAALSYSSVKSERFPSLMALADYGTIGSSINHAFPTRTYGAILRVPVFDGGRRDARRAEAAVELRQQRIRTEDLTEQVRLEVRLALDALRSAESQIKVAAEGVDLAQNELTQARRRYEAGVTTNIEVTDAQVRLERARENHLEALYQHNLARIDLAAAMGVIHRIIQ
jgi:outer membrane protein TolC